MGVLVSLFELMLIQRQHPPTYFHCQGLLSKTIPKSLARGVLNAGLLSTQAGTLGRVVGDLWLSGATYMGLNEMLNRLFEPMCVTLGVSIFVVIWSYPRLQPRFDDEDD